MDAKKKGKKFIGEFKEFISRGNVMDMAVGIIIGSAFTAIVNSLVKDMIMPVVGKIIGGINFSDLKIVLTAAVGDAPEVAVCYGSFLQQILDFLIIAFVVFLMVKAVNSLRKRLIKEQEPVPEEPQIAEPSEEARLLTEIRDLLKK